MASTAPLTLRVISVSSMRRTKRPPWCLAKSQLKRAVLIVAYMGDARGAGGKANMHRIAHPHTQPIPARIVATKAR